MTKFKKFISVLAAAILCLGVFSFVACNNDKPTAATAYTIYVKDASGNAIQNVMIGICTYDEATGEKGACLTPSQTDANGKVVLQATEATYIVNEEIFASEYNAQEKCVLKAYGDYTLVLISKSAK